MLVELNPHLCWSILSIEAVEQRGKPSGAEYTAYSLLPFAVPPDNYKINTVYEQGTEIGLDLSLFMFSTLDFQGSDVYELYIVNFFLLSNYHSE